MINVLLVEDDIDLAATIVDYLDIESIHCDHASNGLMGLELIQRNHYQMMMLDINGSSPVRVGAVLDPVLLGEII